MLLRLVWSTVGSLCVAMSVKNEAQVKNMPDACTGPICGYVADVIGTIAISKYAKGHRCIRRKSIGFIWACLKLEEVDRRSQRRRNGSLTFR
jgi:hypothetical protein